MTYEALAVIGVVTVAFAGYIVYLQHKLKIAQALEAEEAKAVEGMRATTVGETVVTGFSDKGILYRSAGRVRTSGTYVLVPEKLVRVTTHPTRVGS